MSPAHEARELYSFLTAKLTRQLLPICPGLAFCGPCRLTILPLNALENTLSSVLSDNPYCTVAKLQREHDRQCRRVATATKALRLAKALDAPVKETLPRESRKSLVREVAKETGTRPCKHGNLQDRQEHLGYSIEIQTLGEDGTPYGGRISQEEAVKNYDAYWSGRLKREQNRN